MKIESLSQSQVERVEAFKRDFADLLIRHNVRLEIDVSKWAHVDGECSKAFVFMTSDPTKYDGEPFSDMRLEVDELESQE